MLFNDVVMKWEQDRDSTWDIDNHPCRNSVYFKYTSSILYMYFSEKKYIWSIPRLYFQKKKYKWSIFGKCTSFILQILKYTLSILLQTSVLVKNGFAKKSVL